MSWGFSRIGLLARMSELSADSSNEIIVVGEERKPGAMDSILPTYTFPDEIVEDILIRVWLCSEWTHPKDRWIAYCKLLNISRQWNHIIQSVVLQYRVLETLVDFQVYSHFCSSPEQPPCSRRYKYLRMPWSDLALSFLAPFEMSSFVASCDELDVSPMPNGRLWSLCHMLGNADSQSRALSFNFEEFAADIHLEKRDGNVVISYPPKLPLVTTLDITCTNPELLEWIYRDVVDVRAMLYPFPNLAHLRINLPVPLFLVAEYLQSLVTLTLDIPPTYTKKPHPTSLSNWGIVPALKNHAIAPEKIVIESGLKPVGWEELCKVCDTLGIQAIFVLKYTETYVMPTPGRSAEKGLHFLAGERLSLLLTSLHNN